MAWYSVKHRENFTLPLTSITHGFGKTQYLSYVSTQCHFIFYYKFNLFIDMCISHIIYIPSDYYL